MRFLPEWIATTKDTKSWSCTQTGAFSARTFLANPNCLSNEIEYSNDIRVRDFGACTWQIIPKTWTKSLNGWRNIRTCQWNLEVALLNSGASPGVPLAS